MAFVYQNKNITRVVLGFLPFYGVVTLAGVVAAIIVPKLPPLSKVPESYYTEVPHREDIPDGMSAYRYGMQLALKKAEKAPGINAFFLEGAENVYEMWFGTLPVMATSGMESSIAVAIPVTRLVAPGPLVANTTPVLPVDLA